MTFVGGEHLPERMFASDVGEEEEEEEDRDITQVAGSLPLFNSTINISLPVLTLAVLE